jgi:hypothetical protein
MSGSQTLSEVVLIVEMPVPIFGQIVAWLKKVRLTNGVQSGRSPAANNEYDAW